MIKNTYILGLAMLVMFNCKSAKTITGGQANLSLSTRQLIKENAKQSPDFKTLQSKLKITYTNKGNTQTHSVSFRAKKDEMLWMSATFSVVKALVTPEKVSFYNKLDNTYFDGDFTFISNWLGTDISFNQLQAILLGEVLYPIDSKTHKSEILEDGYLLQPKQQLSLFEQFITLHPGHFRVKSQEIAQPKDFRILNIDYKKYHTSYCIKRSQLSISP